MVRATREPQASPRGREGSFEVVEELPLYAMLDLTPSEHELQDLVDGMLRVFLLGEVLDDAVL